MDEFIKQLPELIATLTSLIALFVSATEYKRRKMTDIKVKIWQQEHREREEQKSEYISKIYGEMWNILHTLHADRVYIVQPHPLLDSQYISISLEVIRKGVSKMSPNIHNLKLSEVSVMTEECTKKEWIVCRNIEKDIKDKKARAILSCNGSVCIIMKKLTNEIGRWIGNISCDFTNEPAVWDVEAMKRVIEDSANNIQYILPEYKNKNKDEA